MWATVYNIEATNAEIHHILQKIEELHAIFSSDTGKQVC